MKKFFEFLNSNNDLIELSENMLSELTERGFKINVTNSVEGFTVWIRSNRLFNFNEIKSEYIKYLNKLNINDIKIVIQNGANKSYYNYDDVINSKLPDEIGILGVIIKK